jgi:K+-sensing histidine kinase KdpD
MKPSLRQNIVRLLAVIITIALAVVFLTNGGYPLPDNLLAWIPLLLMAVVITATQHLAIPMAYEDTSFLPMMITMAYLSLGWEPGMLAAGVGLLVGGIGLALWRSGGKTRFGQVAAALWPLAHHGLSLFAAHWSYRALAAAPPLLTLSRLEDVVAVITLTFVYLIVFDLLLVLDIWLAGQRVWPTLVASRQPLLATQVLPLALPPLSAIAYHQLGLPALIILQVVLLTIALVVNRLVYAQSALQQRVQELSSLTSVGQAMRASLELNSLLETLYLQVANLLQVKNFHTAMLSADGKALTYPLAVRHGRREDIKRQPLADKSFVGWVLKESKPLLAANVKATAEEKGLTPPDDKALTWLGIPLVSSEGTLGCIYIWRESGELPARPFTQADLDMMTSVTLQAGIAVQNALLYQETRRHASQLTTLNQITTAMNATLDPERVLELVSDSTIEVAGCDKVAIYLLTNEDKEANLILAHAKGFAALDAVRTLDCDTLLAEEERATVMQKLKAVTIPDMTEPKADVTPELMRLAQEEKIRACAYFPLRAQEKAIGVLAVYHDEPHPFTGSEIELLETFANQAAMAVTNARIYQRVDLELTRRVEQIIKLTDINRRLSSTLDSERIFDLIIDSALEGCKAGAGVLVISDKELLGSGEGSSMVAWRGYDPTVKGRAPHQVAEKLVHSRVLESGETMLVTQRREGENGDGDADTLPRSQLSVPVMLEERVIGAIALESDEASAFSDDDINFVSQLAAQAAVAIRNARLFRHAQDVSDRLKAILDAGNDGLLMVDSRSRIIMTNTRMGAFWDFARQDFPRRSPEEFMADPLTALGEGLGYKEGELRSLIEEGQRKPNVASKSDLYVTKPIGGQRQRYVERAVTPVQDEGGDFIGLLLVFRDVTEQKELESARESLTHMIVHDLRSPLQAVMGSLTLIDKALPEKNKVVEQATDVSGRALRKLLNLVNNLLDLSSMEQGEFAPDVAVEGIGSILEDAAAELMTLAKEVSVVVEVDAPKDLPEVMIDRDMIGRLVLNLLDNALKYTKAGTLVKLRANVVPGDQDKNMMRVQVVDNGPGVPAEYKEAIFDRFAQIPGRRGQRRSSGIGLAFCRSAVQAHGGRIWVEDNPDGGAIFAFTLPLATLEPPKKQP